MLLLFLVWTFLTHSDMVHLNRFELVAAATQARMVTLTAKCTPFNLRRFCQFKSVRTSRSCRISTDVCTAVNLTAAYLQIKSFVS